MIDVTDHNVILKEVGLLKQIKKEKIFVVDKNWFGGCWKLEDYFCAEKKLDLIINEITKLASSPFESFILAYYFASDREFKFAPKGSPFQSARSYVDAINSGYCVCVGFATILKRLCEKLNIECAVQGCYAKNKFGKIVNHANNLVFLNDEKYGINGLYYSDSRMDCLNFAKESNGLFTKFNFLAMPITDIGKIQIKVWQDDTIIEMNDFQSLYYTRHISENDKDYLSKFFSKATLNNVMRYKYCKPIHENTIFEALKNLCFNEDEINEIQKAYSSRKQMFFSDINSIAPKNEWEKRLAFKKYLKEFVSHSGRKKDVTKLDCATFVNYVFKNFFDVNIMQSGFGKSWTGKILTSVLGEQKLIDEKLSLNEKLSFIDKKCKVGDILIFHRRSKRDNHTTCDNWYPGHCGIYLGNHKYIDSRLTTRGNIEIVNMENDNYMHYFIGCKDIISDLENLSEIEKSL